MPYAGGTELVQVMKMGLARPELLVDLKGVPELRGIARTADGLRVGSLATHREVHGSAVVADVLPSMSRMAHAIGNIRVRSIGTIGGNLCFAEPHSDPTVFLLACAAMLELDDGRAARAVSIDEFVRGPFETGRRADELLVAIHIPIGAGDSIAHRRVARLERPSVTVTVRLTPRAGRPPACRIAVGSVGPRPELAAEAARAIEGNAHPSRAARLAGEAASAECAAEADIAGGEAYKRQLVRVLTERAVLDAFRGLAVPV